MALTETLVLDIAAAQRNVDQIVGRLVAGTQQFKVGLADALGLLTRPTEVAIDATGVTTGIDAAVQAADTSIEPDDTSAITTGIDEAVAAADGTVPVESDGAESITADVDDAVATADGSVSVEAVGADAITADIDAAVAAADTTVEIEGDTSALNAELDSTAASARGAAESLEGTGSALGVVQGTSQLATGDLAGVGATLGSVSARGSALTSVLLAVAAATGVTIGAALESETAQRRYNEALGDFATQVANPAIGGFADSLEQLAERTGNSDEALKLAVARVFDLGTSSDVAGAQVAATTEQIALLAVRASVLNPTLGDAGQITEALTGALARGGRTLNDYGLSINAAEIEQRALADTNKRSADELTQYDRAAAGAAIATERLGERLRTDIVQGADQPAIALRRLREEFGNTLETFGAPLLDPLVQAAEAAQPVLLGLSAIFASLAETGLPLVVTGLRAAEPAIRGVGLVTDALLAVLGPVVSLIDAIPEPVVTAVGTFLALRSVLGPVPDLVSRVALGASQAAAAIGTGGLSAAFATLVSPIGLVTVGLTAAILLISRHNEEQEKQRKALEEGRKAFLDSAEATEKYIDSQIRARIESKNQTDDLTRLGLSVEQFRALLEDGQLGLEQFAGILVDSGEITRAAADDILGLTEAQEGQIRASELGVAGNVGLLKSARDLQNQLQERAKAAVETLVAEDKLSRGTVHATEILTRRRDGTTDYIAVLRESNLLVAQRATAEIAAGRATEEARSKNAVLAAQYEELNEVLTKVKEGSTATETAVARAGPSFQGVVDTFVAGIPSVEQLAEVQSRYGLSTETLASVLDEARARAEEARKATDAFVQSVVEGIPGVTSANEALSKDTGIRDYLKRVTEDVTAASNFLKNIAELSRRGADDLAQAFATRGVEAAKAAQEATRLGARQLTAAETTVEKAKVTDAANIERARALGVELEATVTTTNTRLSATPGPNLAVPMATATAAARGTLLAGLSDIERQAAIGGNAAGVSLGRGFAGGIAQAAPTATTEAETMARRTVEAAKRLLRAFSPSRVMIDLGRSVPQGLALGIAEDIGLVERAADRMALAAIPSLGSVTAPAVASVVVADAVVRSTGGTASTAPGGPAVVVGSGGTFLRIEATFGPGSDQQGVTEALREFAREELTDALGRVGMRVNMQGSGR